MSTTDGTGAASPEDKADLMVICIGLDRTLIRGSSLVESLTQLLRQSPASLFALPFWALRGRAVFKEQIGRRLILDVSALPFHQPLLEKLRELKHRHTMVLCTDANEHTAGAVAAHLGLFDFVIASTRSRLLTGVAKEKALREQLDGRPFGYVGMERGDGVLRHLTITSIAEKLPPSIHPKAGAWIKSIRLTQWIKNALVFLPMLAAHRFDDWHAWMMATAAFLAFGLCASSHYIVNDLMDLAADRRHPRKQMRMFASGAMPPSHGLVLSPLLLLAAILVAVWVGPLFAIVLATYYVSTTAYTFWLKRVPILDALVLAGLYTIRVLAGAAAVQVVPSFWLLAFSMFFFLSLALAKRHAEILELGLNGDIGVIPGREYRNEDKITLISQGAASGYAAILVLAFYINSDEVHVQYEHPQIIWLVCPLLLYWINKLWLNSQRREILEDPVVWAMTNRVSRAVFVICAVLILAAI